MQLPTGQRLGRFARLLICASLLAAPAPWSAPVATEDAKTVSVVAPKTDSVTKTTTITVANVETKTDSVVTIRTIPVITKKFEERYNRAAAWVFAAFLLWILGVVVYLVWAIRFYVHNYGLSDHEWKVLNPEVYATAGKEMQKYQAIRANSLAVSGSCETIDAPQTASNPSPNCPPVCAPDRNPYQGESFGLPPGTIRGILALSAMVAFLLIEALNIFSPNNLEGDFKELITVFEMVIAFYFGAKAIDIFNKRSETPAQDKVVAKVADDAPPRREPTPSNSTGRAGDSTSTPPSASPTPKPAAPPPAEQPALPASQANTRQTNLVENHVATIPGSSQKNDSHAPTLDANTSLAKRVLAMTASFETDKGFPDCFGGISGDFDGQGLSFGALQWCLGQKSLQPLFKAMFEQARDEAENALGAERLKTLQDVLAMPLDQQLAWARGIQFTQRNSAGKRVLVIDAQWRSALVALGKTDTMIKIQTEQAGVRFQKALANCKEYECVTERAVALFFDINVQNGRVDVSGTKARIVADVAKLSRTLDPVAKEVETLKIVAQRRAEVSNPQWRADVLSRKMAIATGAGKVHGRIHDFEKEFAIRLVKASDLA
jgi:hypothetical protein